jgi:hypothetical protein
LQKLRRLEVIFVDVAAMMLYLIIDKYNVLVQIK